MKPLKNIKLVLLALIIPILWGCSNGDLSRGKAEKLIRESYKFPADEIRKFSLSFPDHGGPESFKDLQDEGLLSYSKNFAGLGGYWYYGVLTEKGKQYAASDIIREGNFNEYINIKAATLDFGEITGIVENKESNTAIVNYTYIRKDITPFGRIAFNLKEGTNNFTRTFTKYDDGWRINDGNRNK